MSTETNNPHINKIHLPNYLAVRQKIGNIDVGGISLEIGGVLSSTNIYEWRGIGSSIFDYVCYYHSRMAVMLY